MGYRRNSKGELEMIFYCGAENYRRMEEIFRTEASKEPWYKDPKYNIPKEEIGEVVREVMKDYKDPTEGMVYLGRIGFDKAMRAEIKKVTYKSK